jgi:fluoroacetyl-CoA thioesterase
VAGLNVLPEPGVSAAFDELVGDGDTAAALGSGDVAVLATPRVLALAERATVQAVAGALDPDETTVGAHVELDHLRPSFVGASIPDRATLTG